MLVVGSSGPTLILEQFLEASLGMVRSPAASGFSQALLPQAFHLTAGGWAMGNWKLQNLGFLSGPLPLSLALVTPRLLFYLFNFSFQSQSVDSDVSHFELPGDEVWFIWPNISWPHCVGHWHLGQAHWLGRCGSARVTSYTTKE